MDTQSSKQYSLVRFWRYIFVPLVLILIAFVWYIVFNISGTQLGVGGMTLYTNSLRVPSSNVSSALAK